MKKAEKKTNQRKKNKYEMNGDRRRAVGTGAAVNERTKIKCPKM